MPAITAMQWEVLNATADDWENLETIHSQLRGSTGNGRAVSLSDVADAIYELTTKGLLTARHEGGEILLDYRDARYVWRCWFGMTEAGRKAWHESAPVSATTT